MLRFEPFIEMNPFTEEGVTEGELATIVELVMTAFHRVNYRAASSLEEIAFQPVVGCALMCPRDGANSNRHVGPVFAQANIYLNHEVQSPIHSEGVHYLNRWLDGAAQRADREVVLHRSLSNQVAIAICGMWYPYAIEVAEQFTKMFAFRLNGLATTRV